MNAGLFPWNVYFLLKDPVHQFSLKPQRKSPNNDGVSCELNRDGRLFLGRGVAVDFLWIIVFGAVSSTGEIPFACMDG